MACVDSDKFSANDLALFIESMEQISRMESLKRQRHQRNRSLNLDQQFTDESSSTITCSDKPVEESIMESFEEKHIGYNSTCLVQNQYYAVDYEDDYYYQQPQDNDSLDCQSTIYSMPYDCEASTKLDVSGEYETLNLQPTDDLYLEHEYEEPSEVLKSLKTKRKLSLFGLVRKKYKKCFASKSNNWRKSESWTKLTVA